MASNDKQLVTIAVNGEPWSLRPTLADSGPETRAYTVEFLPGGRHRRHVRRRGPWKGGRLSMTIRPETPLPVSLRRTAREPTPELGSYAGGVIHDLTGSYATFFAAAALLAAAAAGIAWTLSETPIVSAVETPAT